MEFIPDCQAAKNIIRDKRFHEYSQAYICTNEDLRMSMKYIPKNCNRALVVAASGDHPLFCSLFGAKHVDTFDISYNAKCIMDIKTAAIECLDYSEYFDLLLNLWWKNDVKDIQNMDIVSENLSSIEFKYLCSMKGYRLFNQGAFFGESDECMLTEQEYEKLRGIIKEPYNFIMADIMNLSDKLTSSYDFMHLSNIFDYVDKPKDQFDVLSSLFKHVNIGGRILIEHITDSAWQKNPFLVGKAARTRDVFKDWRFRKYGGNISCFERVRG